MLLNHHLQTPRKANSQAPPQTYWIKLWAGAQQVPRWCWDIQNLRTHWFLRRRYSLSNALIVAAHWNHPGFKTYQYLKFWAGACGSMLILKKILWGFYGSSPQNDSSEADGSILPFHWRPILPPELPFSLSTLLCRDLFMPKGGFTNQWTIPNWYIQPKTL